MIDHIRGMFTTHMSTKLFAIVAAVGLWIGVLVSRNVEVSKDIPLEVITPADAVPANEIPEKITFRLSGPKAFLRAVLDRREEPIRVNLSGSKPGLVTYRFFSDNIHLPIGVKVQTINPAAILVKLEYVKRREVPLKVELRGIPPEGFRIARTEVRPSTLRIKGAESRVDSISEVTTTPIDVSNLKQDLEREAPLDLSRYNVQVDGSLPVVRVDVEAETANYRIKNVDIRVLSPYKSTVAEKTVTVLVNASPQDLKTLDRSQVYGIVDLRGKPRGKYEEEVKVILPDEIGLVRVVPDKVRVTLH